MRLVLLSRLLTLALAGSACAAQAVVIDFNGIDTSGSGTNPTVTVPKPYVEDGFTLNTYSGSPYAGYGGGTMYALTPANALWTGSPSVYSGVITNYGSGFSMARQDGGSFDLLSMDAAAMVGGAGRNFTVFGYPAAGGGFVQQNFVLDDSYTTLETLTLDSRFRDLNLIQFSSVYAQVDNIQLGLPGVAAPVVSSVPEPETYVLMLAGLAGLATFARRGRADVANDAKDAA